MTSPAQSAHDDEGGPLAGPWSSGFWLRVPFALQSKSNFRRGREAHGRSWSALRGFESSMGVLATAYRPDAWQVGDGSVPVARRPAVLVCIAARSMVDTANFSKSVLDACEGVLFVSDASVLAVSSLGVRTREQQQALVGFAQVPPGTDLVSLGAALGELTTQVAAQAATHLG